MKLEIVALLVESSPRWLSGRGARAALVVLVLAGTALRAQEQIFLDGFETGDPYRWSSFAPSVSLTLTNYLSWCTFTIGDGEPSGDASLTRAFLPDDVVALTGAPKPGFVWGYWTGTDSDAGSGDPNPQTTVTMSADKSVLECCPFMAGMTCK